MPPDDPLGRNGPSLDNFLRIKAVPSELPPPCPYGKTYFAPSISTYAVTSFQERNARMETSVNTCILRGATLPINLSLKD